ncbi:LOW QUALITY PROTEIN: ataxin-7-like protein 1 [Helicoverpa armigera]|uniref:LOW QUALITY PROTEIN: ataxin-7-like protein 1 n=1 Tax=Helicoverpa armigera TaxID=29058 RepID=UPI003082C2A9
MSGDYPFTAKIVSPVKCNEKPWDLWVSEIGHLSPRRDDDATFTSPAAVDGKGGASVRRGLDAHPYKQADRQARYRRAGLNRLKYESMSLHGLFPQMDNLNAAVCHMCGVIVKCSAAYRHLLESHTGAEPLPPPPPPVSTHKSRSRHKKEPPPPPIPVDLLPVKMDSSPVHTATPPLSRLMLPPQPDLQYLDEASTSSTVPGEVKVSMECGELPVVSIQDTEDLPLGENLTDDIFAIMNSEGIQSADDITNAADWKNIIRDIGNMGEINFPQASDNVPAQDLYAPIHTSSLSAYAISDSDLSNIQFAPNTSPMLPTVMETTVLNPPPLKPAVTPTTPSTKSSRSKTSKTKFNLREYDPNKHCGVVTAENPKPCTRSLTCKAHALSLRRTVEGRSKPFDTLLAEHRASRDAGAAAAAAAAAAPAPAPAPLVPAPAPPPAPITLPPLLVNTSIDLSSFNGLTAEQQVNDIYASLLNVEDPNSVLPDTSSITSLLSQPLAPEAFLMPDDAEIPADVPILSIASPLETPAARLDDKPDEAPPPLVPADVCWYSSCPRPLAICTFNASHAGGAITLGKKFATVRSNIKSSLSRSQCKSSGSVNNYYYNPNALSLSKTVHMNASKTNKPEVRKLIVTCSGGAGGAALGAHKEVQQTLSELFGGEVRHALNGHAPERRRPPLKAPGKRPPAPVLDLGFSLDPLLADEKC